MKVCFYLMLFGFIYEGSKTVVSSTTFIDSRFQLVDNAVAVAVTYRSNNDDISIAIRNNYTTEERILQVSSNIIGIKYKESHLQL